MKIAYSKPAPITGEGVYTVAEAAELLRISTNTMYKLVKQGVFSCRKVGRHIRISKTSLENWLNEQAIH